MLSGENIFLRAIEPGDIDVLYKWENDSKVWHVSNTITPFSRHLLEQYVNSIQDIFSEKQLRLMIDLPINSNNPEEGRRAIGAVDLFDFDPHHQRAGVGILIAEKGDRGKGHASEAIGLLINYAFQILSLHQLYCNIPVNNTVSLKLFQNHNFQVIGKKREWIRNGNNWEDEYLLQLISELKKI